MNRETDNSANSLDDNVTKIVESIDRDVERGEDIVMAGLCIVMMSTFFAPIAPPAVLSPFVAITFAVSAGLARLNYRKIERKLTDFLVTIEEPEQSKLRPIQAVLKASPYESLGQSFNPFKNIKRTFKSVLGGLLINPLWMPIFYMIGLQIEEEKKLIALNQAVMSIEQESIDNPYEFYA